MRRFTTVGAVIVLAGVLSPKHTAPAMAAGVDDRRQ
jgi:hypothetical protein